jgi:hypothetical protein
VKPIICFGHDGCIFKQFILTGKSWKEPNDETAVAPKDDGAGVINRAFQFCEFGFGLHLTDDQTKVNKYCEGKFYSDVDAAIAMRQSKKKNTLTSTPFIQEFEYEKANEGYWAYQWMVCQFDDFADVLKDLHGNMYDVMFLFEHSCGHDKKSSDGLIVENRKKCYGGKQPIMQDTTMKNTRGYLGTFSKKET